MGSFVRSLEGISNVITHHVRMLDCQRAQSISHHRSPEGSQVGRHSLTHVLIDRHVRRNLASHRDQTLVLVRQRWLRSAHAGTPDEGRTWTAVTLYSGQFVAQSEFSVVTTLVPLTG